MERSKKNKENVARNGSILKMFKVKKCLFDPTISNKDKESSPNKLLPDSPMVISPCVEGDLYSHFTVKKKKSVVESKVSRFIDYSASSSNVTTPTNKKLDNTLDTELSSPNLGQHHLSGSPMTLSPCLEDSPYSLFTVKKKRSVVRSNSCASDSVVTTPTGKKHADNKDMENIVSCYQQSSNAVKLAIQKSMLDSNLTGDFSKPCFLPTIQGRHPDLKTVSPTLVASLLNGSFSCDFTLIDCRYPYEYEGGHIRNAHNIYLKEDIVTRLLDATTTFERKESSRVLIFYCEFSSERGPSMLRHLRNTDRDMNRDFYPFLFYPELYVMEGGYKAFFSNFQELCDPQEYKRMLDKDCADQLAFYKSKCKSTSRSTKRLKRTRSSLVF